MSFWLVGHWKIYVSYIFQNPSHRRQWTSNPQQILEVDFWNLCHRQLRKHFYWSVLILLVTCLVTSSVWTCKTVCFPHPNKKKRRKKNETVFNGALCDRFLERPYFPQWVYTGSSGGELELHSVRVNMFTEAELLIEADPRGVLCSQTCAPDLSFFSR